MLRAVIACCLLPAAVAAEVVYPANPWLLDDVVVVSASGVFAFDRASLAPRWSALEKENTQELVADGDSLYVASSRGLHALAVDDGSTRWAIRTGGLAFAPTLVDDRLYLGNRQGVLRALSTLDGNEIWAQVFPGWVYGPAVSGERLVTGGRNGSLWGLDPSDGSIAWTRNLTQELVYRPVATSGGRVVTTTFDGRVSAFDARTGTPAWQLTDVSPALSPVSADGRLFLTRLDGRAQAMDAAAGRFLWSQDLIGRASAAPVVSDDRVLIAHGERRISILSSATGEFLQTNLSEFRIFGSPAQIDGRTVIFVSDIGNPSGVRPVVIQARQNQPTQ